MSWSAEGDVARRLARLSTLEIKAALRAGGAPAPVRALIAALARLPSARLGRALARFDRRTGEVGLSAAAAEVLGALGARVACDGECPKAGGVLLVTNHPGAFDALALMASLGRDDVALVAADRAFLRAMPALAGHFFFVPEGADASPLVCVTSVRRALAWVGEGHVVVQFGAGTIEPDPRFPELGKSLLAEWAPGTGLLAARAARGGAAIVPCLVSGVHSARAKRLPVVRWAERRGVTTIAPLIQATLPGFRDVEVAVRLGGAIDGGAVLAAGDDGLRAEILRSAVARLAR